MASWGATLSYPLSEAVCHFATLHHVGGCERGGLGRCTRRRERLAHVRERQKESLGWAWLDIWDIWVHCQLVQCRTSEACKGGKRAGHEGMGGNDDIGGVTTQRAETRLWSLSSHTHHTAISESTNEHTPISPGSEPKSPRARCQGPQPRRADKAAPAQRGSHRLLLVALASFFLSV